MVAFTTERGNPNKIGFNLIYINLKYTLFVLHARAGGPQNTSSSPRHRLLGFKSLFRFAFLLFVI